VTVRTRLAHLLRRAARRLDPPPAWCVGHPSTFEPQRPDLHLIRDGLGGYSGTRPSSDLPPPRPIPSANAPRRSL
jgi:hypothetical protein